VLRVEFGVNVAHFVRIFIEITGKLYTIRKKDVEILAVLFGAAKPRTFTPNSTLNTPNY
jgi:hypothetical protein